MDFNAVSSLFFQNVDAVLVADAASDSYRAYIRRGIFSTLIEETGKYKDLIEILWIHFNNTQDKITEDYKVFLPSYGRFKGKSSRRLKLYLDSRLHAIQMMVYPIGDDRYLYLMDELEDESEETISKKVESIQNTFLFSMYIDLAQDSISSLSITEVSDETVHAALSYTQWRMMIVNMIGADDQSLFLERTDPDYLKKNLAPGRTASFDCLMQNLEGKYIWVKLIFSRAETINDDDYRYVFMVQNIHEESVRLFDALKKYERLALNDSLTGIYNHGRIETEIANALDSRRKHGRKASVAMIDIDLFKQINDTFGHSVGDDTLKRITTVFRDCLKDANAVIGRWGGEEFVVVLYDQDGAQAVALVERCRSRIEQTAFPGTGGVTCSIGVTEMTPEDTVQSAFERMDRALYRAKTEGRNRVRME